MSEVTRREALGGSFAAAILGWATGSRPVDADDSVAKLVSWFGGDAVLTALSDEMASGPVTFDGLRRRLNRQKRREIRNYRASQRRASHQDCTAYRGPALIDAESLESIEMCLRPVRSGVSRKTLLVGVSDQPWMLGEYRIPTGSRLLIDARYDLTTPVVQAELIETENDKARWRLHLWAFRGGDWKADKDRDSLPRLQPELQQVARTLADDYLDL